MKKLTFFTLILTAGALFSCQQDTDTFDDAALAELDLESELAAESSMEEVDLIAEAGMETFYESSDGRFGRDEILDCAEVTRDTVNKIVTIDYGDGCEGPGGSIKSGKIIIEYNDHKYVPGAYRIITFENFYIDSIHVEGVRTLTNTTDSTSTLQFEVTLVGGKLTFPDETTYTRDSELIRTWFRADDRVDDYSTLEGEAAGENRRGVDYSMEIIEPLVFKRSCRNGRVVVPVSGIIQKTVGDHVVTIDFGDGECDNIAVVTINGVSKRVFIYPRGRRLLG